MSNPPGWKQIDRTMWEFKGLKTVTLRVSYHDERYGDDRTYHPYVTPGTGPMDQIGAPFKHGFDTLDQAQRAAEEVALPYIRQDLQILEAKQIEHRPVTTNPDPETFGKIMQRALGEPPSEV